MKLILLNSLYVWFVKRVRSFIVLSNFRILQLVLRIFECLEVCVYCGLNLLP